MKRLVVAETKAEAIISQEDQIYLFACNSSFSGRCFKKVNDSPVNSSLIWFIDSGASSHMTPELSSFSKLKYIETFSVGMSEEWTFKAERLVGVKRSSNLLGTKKHSYLRCTLRLWLIIFLHICGTTREAWSTHHVDRALRLHFQRREPIRLWEYFVIDLHSEHLSTED